MNFELNAAAEQVFPLPRGFQNRIPSEVREMRQAAHQCRDLYLAYLYQKAAGMGVEHLTHAIGSDLDAQAIHHERLRTLRRKRAGLNLLSATLMALATGPNSEYVRRTTDAAGILALSTRR